MRLAVLYSPTVYIFCKKKVFISSRSFFNMKIIIKIKCVCERTSVQPTSSHAHNLTPSYPSLTFRMMTKWRRWSASREDNLDEGCSTSMTWPRRNTRVREETPWTKSLILWPWKERRLWKWFVCVLSERERERRDKFCTCVCIVKCSDCPPKASTFAG